MVVCVDQPRVKNLPPAVNHLIEYPVSGPVDQPAGSRLTAVAPAKVRTDLSDFIVLNQKITMTVNVMPIITGNDRICILKQDFWH